MELYEYIIIAVTMAMDAFAVSVCKGVSSKDKYLKTGLVCGTWFGGFQALMPLLGWSIGVLFTKLVNIESLSGYIAFFLLAFLGGKMIKESLEKDDDCPCACNEKNSSLGFRVMFVFAIATSIDALAVGVTVSLLDANIWLAITLIGVITFILSFIGSIIGAKIGSKFEKKAEFGGGIVLVLLALKFLIEAIL